MTDYPPGWTCEVVAVRLTRYRSSGLPLSDALAMAEHLEACILCVQRLLLLEPPGVGSRG